MYYDNKKFICLYHENCIDGTMSAAVLKYLSPHSQDIEFIPSNYNNGQEPLPYTLEGKIVYLVDFSLPPKKIIEYAKFADYIVILDHHVSAIRDYEDVSLPGNVHTVFDVNRSGAGLTWDYCDSPKTRPRLVSLVEDRDLWRFAYGEDSKYIHYCLQLLNYQINQYVTALKTWDIEAKIQEGKVLHEFFMNQVHLLSKNTFWIPLGGYDCVPVCNVPYFYASEVANKLASYSACGWAATFSLGENEIFWSLRSIGDVDVSVIAKQYGGGGHKNAAGFKCGYPGLKSLDFISQRKKIKHKIWSQLSRWLKTLWK
jgi:oligoribonuclease NrnB/cAMP/cGMP phosphodiesterase (DHH superfamily)